MTRIITLLLALFLAGCETLPTATYTTANGCGIAQWTKDWVEANVSSMTWDGACSSGLANGTGKHEVLLKNGRRKTYVGKMADGMITGDGELTFENGLKAQGSFLWSSLTYGKVIRGDGKVLFDGLMAHNDPDANGRMIEFKDQRYGKGTLYFNDAADSRIEEGVFDLSAGLYTGIGSIDPTTGKGIIVGRYVRGGNVVYRMVEKRFYPTETAFQEAQLQRLNRILAQLEQSNRVQTAALKEQSDRETSEAIGQFLGTLGQMQAGQSAQRPVAVPPPQTISSNSPTANRPSSTGGSNSGSSNSDRSRVIAADGRSAKGCVVLRTIAKDSNMGGGGRVIANNCGETIEIGWCYVDNECGRDSGNQWNIRAGGSWPVSASREIMWGACYGPDTFSFERGSKGTRVICRAPLR